MFLFLSYVIFFLLLLSILSLPVVLVGADGFVDEKVRKNGHRFTCRKFHFLFIIHRSFYCFSYSNINSLIYRHSTYVVYFFDGYFYILCVYVCDMVVMCSVVMVKPPLALPPHSDAYCGPLTQYEPKTYIAHYILHTKQKKKTCTDVYTKFIFICWVILFDTFSFWMCAIFLHSFSISPRNANTQTHPTSNANINLTMIFRSLVDFSLFYFPFYLHNFRFYFPYTTIRCCMCVVPKC